MPGWGRKAIMSRAVLSFPSYWGRKMMIIINLKLIYFSKEGESRSVVGG